MLRRRRILIAGYFGFGNLGDEAILSGMLRDLRAQDSKIDYAVLSGDPAQTSIDHNVHSLLWTNVAGIVDTVQDVDLVILGGGGLFHDYWGVDGSSLLRPGYAGLSYYCGIPLLATFAEKPTMIYAAGVGPLLHEAGRSLTRMAFESAGGSTVRDHESQRLLAEIGVPRSRVRVTADPSFSLLAPLPVPSPIVGEGEGLPTVAVCLRNWDVGVDPMKWQAEVAAGLDRFVEAHRDVRLRFVPFQRMAGNELTDDSALAARIMQQMQHSSRVEVLTETPRPEQMVQFFSGCRLVVGMRYHAVVLAALAGAPCVAISYDPKVMSVVDQLGLKEFAIRLPALTRSDLFAAMNRAWSSQHPLRSVNASRLAALRRRSRMNAELTLALLRRGSGYLSRRGASYSRQFVLERIVQLAGQDQQVELLRQMLSEQESAARMRVAAIEQSTARAEVEHRHREEQLQQEILVKGDALRTAAQELTAKGDALRTAAQELTAKGDALRTLTRELDARQEELGAASSLAARQAEELERQRATLTQLQQWGTALEQQVDAITRSTGWALLQMVWKVRRMLAPPGAWGPLRVLIRRLPARAQARARGMYESMAGRRLKPSRTMPVAVSPARPEPAELRGARGLVHILAPLFFDHDGAEMMRGGAERYVLQLAPLIERQGYDVRLYQSARGSWRRFYGGVHVQGIDTGGDPSRLSEYFHNQIAPGALTIYLAFYLAAPRCHPRSIGISHGIYWDHPGFQWQESVYQEKMAEVVAALSNLESVVSVDTATINWTRSTRIGLADRFVFIPNFVDCGQFSPRPQRSLDRLVVLYPRRLYAPRGFWLINEILPAVVGRHPSVEFHFVGQADPAEAEAVRDLMRRYPANVRWYTMPPERMHEAYQAADITIIPTTAAEGTSLSCLEAQASGNAVIATHVGGLPDLVHHGYNGLLISPAADALRAALERLIENDDLRRELGENAARVARKFNLPVWEERWTSLLARYLPPVRRSEAEAPTRPTVILPAAPGVTWGRMKQRPHHLAEQLARLGLDVYWQEPSAVPIHPARHLHVTPSGDQAWNERPVVLLYYPYFGEMVGEFRNPIVVYDVLDDISIHNASDDLHEVPPGRRAEDFHRYLLARADIVMASSRRLHEQLVLRRPDVLYVPNGVDVRTFQIRPGGNGDLSSGIDRSHGPVIGYHGALGPWFDYELLERMARQRPGYRFLLIGPAADTTRLQDLLRRCGNVQYLGEQRFEDLPAYVASYDVGIVPFRIDKVTSATRPLKVLECLAMGKPVVASAMPEIAGWPGVHVAQNLDDFVDAIDHAIDANGTPEDSAALVAFARSASWSTVVRPLVREILRCYKGVETPQ